jgi:hypothetical protein
VIKVEVVDDDDSHDGGRVFAGEIDDIARLDHATVLDAELVQNLACTVHTIGYLSRF